MQNYGVLKQSILFLKQYYKYKIYFIHVLISLKSSETMTNLPPWKAMINSIWGKLADINSRKTKGRF